jgi:hypothetical protein
MASKPIAVAWLSGRVNLGVVITHDPINGEEPFKARIGVVTGQDATEDIQYLMREGNKIKLMPAYYVVRDHGMWIDLIAKEELIGRLLEKEKGV